MIEQDALFPESAIQTSGYARPEPREDVEEVSFEYEGRRLTGQVIAWYSTDSGSRVSVADASGAVYSLRADSVTPISAEAA